MSDSHERSEERAWTAALEQQVRATCALLQQTCAGGATGLRGDLDALLSTAAESSAHTVGADAVIVRLQLAEGEPPLVCSSGGAWEGEPGDGSLVVSVPVASSREYGQLLARFAPGTELSADVGARMELQAIALATTLDVTTTLERAGRAGAEAANLSQRLESKRRLLEQAVARYERLVLSFPGIVYLMEVKDGDVLAPIYVSPQVESMIGITVQQWEFDPSLVMRIVHPDDRQAVIDNIRAENQGKPPVPFRMVKPDGSIVWVQSQAVTFSEDGRTFRQGVLRDITQAKNGETERERLETELRLAQKLEAVGELAAGVAHEINTPVQFVGDTLRFLDGAFFDVLALLEAYERLRDMIEPALGAHDALQAVIETEQAAELQYLRDRVPLAFQRAHDGVARVSEIVRAMRSFAHPSTGSMSPADINAALQSTLVVATNVYKYVADVELDLGQLPEVPCDIGEVNQVFLNLIVNAAHAIEAVVGDSGERGRITIRTRHVDSEVVISINDTGCGISTESASRVFDPFFTTKDVGRGSGQGLALARAIVHDRHGGSISFEQNARGGTTFFVRLPVEMHTA